MRQAILGTLMLALVGCQTATGPYQQPTSQKLSSLSALHDDSSAQSYGDYKPSKNKDSGMAKSLRINMLRDMGLSLGAQAGLAKQSLNINQKIQQQSAQLTTIYDFRRLLLPQGILPPVLVEARNTVDASSNAELKLNDRVYQIIAQAHFVTDVPSWRSYLWMKYQFPEVPPKSLWPRTPEETHAWQEAVQKGWMLGIQQAKDIYIENLARLQRDYRGMILYRQLLAQNMVTAPAIAAQNYGVTGGGDNLAINHRTLVITAMPSLQAGSGQWHATIEKKS